MADPSMEAIMVRRRIGQELFRFAVVRGGRSSLDDFPDLIDGVPLECQLGAVSCAARGEPAWPPPALFEALLLAVWYDLSDVKLADALDDRAFPGSGQEAGPRTGCSGGSAAFRPMR
jgi:IS5 family transposase